MTNRFYRDFANGIGKLAETYYPEFLNPETQFVFDTAVIGTVTRTATDVTAYLVEEKKTARALIAGELVMGGIAEIMAYYRYCNAVSARKQKPKTDRKYQNVQDADYREV
ncbi:MAG: hypothetical protein NC548_06365 [Lachnospiraceae bacterium]|nr:hypothetical protein [Lachnospiraceae bacterium]